MSCQTVGSCEFLREASKQQGRYRMVLVLILLSSLQQTAVKEFPELEIAFGPLCLIASDRLSHKRRAIVFLLLTVWARKQFNHQCSKKAIALGYINGIPMFRAGELKYCTFWRCSCQKAGCKTRTTGEKPNIATNYPSIWQTMDRWTKERTMSLVWKVPSMSY